MSGERYALERDVAGEVIDGEAILIHLRTGIYYSLTGSGAAAWQLLLAGHTASESGALLAAAYGVAQADVAVDVTRLVGELAAEGLLRPRDGAAPEHVELSADGPYAPPVLQRYADMGDLLALDPPAPGIDDLSWSFDES
jgi:hypothetical protein